MWGWVLVLALFAAVCGAVAFGGLAIAASLPATVMMVVTLLVGLGLVLFGWLRDRR